jgi:hypothetical protein
LNGGVGTALKTALKSAVFCHLPKDKQLLLVQLVLALDEALTPVSAYLTMY